MLLRNKMSDEILDSNNFPNYGKHDFDGSYSGYLVLTDNNQVLYFYAYDNEILFVNVTEYFEIID